MLFVELFKLGLGLGPSGADLSVTGWRDWAVRDPQERPGDPKGNC